RIVNFIKQLFFNRLRLDETAGILCFRQYEAAFLTDFDDRIAEIFRTGNMFTIIIIVTASCLGAAYTKVTC
ncbi:hypothetical protein NE675_11985, partial [Megasphaera massiliensis]